MDGDHGAAFGPGSDVLLQAGQGEPRFYSSLPPREPPTAGALRSRLALKSAAASGKIVRLNVDKGALRDLRFAAGEDASV
jgi:hypothetical protein